jgi:hypothetical protein
VTTASQIRPGNIIGQRQITDGQPYAVAGDMNLWIDTDGPLIGIADYFPFP